MIPFTEEEQYKIQAVVDLFTSEKFLFTINGKTLETLLVQGGMATDGSTNVLAEAVSDTGSAGTIATSISRYIEKYKDPTFLNLKDPRRIIGFNNLVGANDYDENHALGKELGADFIASGAGVNSTVLKAIKEQSTVEGSHYWTIPIISNLKQLASYLKRNPRIIVVETTDAGGHNGEGLGLEGTLAQMRERNIDFAGNKVTLAGGIRIPDHYVQAIDHGFDAVQIGSAFLGSDEVNYSELFKALVIYAKAGQVGRIPSPAHYSATGFLDEGIMKKIMAGESQAKLACKDKTGEGCLHDCTGIERSASLGEIETPVGDYCIMNALWANNPDEALKKIEYDNLYFSGLRPEELPLEEWANGRTSIPAAEIVGRYLIGVFDSIVSGSYKTPGYEGKINDDDRRQVESAFKGYQNIGPENLSAKIFNLPKWG